MIITIVLLAILMTIGLVIGAMKFYFTDERRMTSETEGEVIAAEERTNVVDGRRVTETQVAIRYRAGIRELEISKVLRGNRSAHFPIGKKIGIRYNPGTPEMATMNL